jgi:LacI family transcriptional regulator
MTPTDCLAHPKFRVALLILNASDWSRKVHEGIAAYARLSGGWDYWLQPRGLREEIEIPQEWAGNGIIGRFADHALRDSIIKRNLPSVNISWHGDHLPELPKVMSDQAICGKMAADHFCARYFTQLGYIGPQSYLGYKDGIFPAVESAAAAHHVKVNRFQPDDSTRSPDLEYQRTKLAQWIKELPKPVGIITWSTIVAREIIVTALQEGFDVPNDVSVLAVEHDPLHSSLSPVPISYIMQRPQVVGYQAAELLDHMMRGGKAPEKPILVAPEGVMETVSTNTAFATDEIVKESIEFIHQHIAEPICVNDLTRAMHVSRRSLEDRFRKVLNRSPAEEIRRIRLHEVKTLLRNTQHSLTEISYKCGFAYLEVMIRFFKKATGETPGEYRRAACERCYSPTP